MDAHSEDICTHLVELIGRLLDQIVKDQLALAVPHCSCVRQERHEAATQRIEFLVVTGNEVAGRIARVDHFEGVCASIL